MTLNGLRRILNITPGNAFAYFVGQTPERRIAFRSYDQMLEFEEKYAYRRPEFLQLDEESEQASADHEARPILIPHRELPLNAGYAESINAGKTLHKNEDQALAGMFCLNIEKENMTDDNKTAENTIEQIKVPYACFGVFDGHAGEGASLMAVNTLHIHVMEKLSGVKSLLACGTDEKMAKSPLLAEAVVSSITIDKLIIGALEEAFFEMDEQIRRERLTFKILGGCTSNVSLFIGQKLYVANAGDSRAIISQKGKLIPLSEDHTPETDRQRLQLIAFQKPQLLGGEFGRLEFQHRARKKYIGQKLLHRDRHMTGWAQKVITEEDSQKFPMITGEGKKSRLLDTIGTTRGFGDHDLKVPYNGLAIKPFLTPQPEVRIYDLTQCEHDEDDVLIMASDGLWERMTSEKAVEIVGEVFKRNPKDDKRRYVVAAQTLIAEVRGTLTERGWRRASGDMGSYDDITVFVIPLNKSVSERITVDHSSS